MKKPIIIFDFDGTIVDSMDLSIRETRKALLQLGLPDMPDEDMRKKVNGPTNVESADLLHVPPEMKEEYLRLRKENGLQLLSECQKLFPNIKEMLADLQHCANIVIASNGVNEYVSASLSLLDMWKYFYRVLTSSTGLNKAQQINNLLKAEKPDRAIMVGDRAGDIIAGKSNGLLTICTAYGYGDKEEWQLADDVAFSVDELKEKLLAFAN